MCTVLHLLEVPYHTKFADCCNQVAFLFSTFSNLKVGTRGICQECVGLVQMRKHKDLRTYQLPLHMNHNTITHCKYTNHSSLVKDELNVQSLFTCEDDSQSRIYLPTIVHLKLFLGLLSSNKLDIQTVNSRFSFLRLEGPYLDFTEHLYNEAQGQQ